MEIMKLGIESSPQIKLFISRLWSAPGFANYFLSGEIFLSKPMKELKVNNLVDELPPQEELLADGTIDPRTKRDLSIHIPFPFIELMSTIFQITVAYSYNSETNLSKLAENAVRVSMKAWTCPFVRASIPTQLFDANPFEKLKQLSQGPFCRCDMFLSLLVMSNFFFKNTLDVPEELLPGLTAKDFLTILVTEDSLYHMVNEDKIRCILQFLMRELPSNAAGEGPWELLTTSDRLLLLNELVQMNILTKERFLPSKGTTTLKRMEESLFLAIAAASTKYVLLMYDHTVALQTQSDHEILYETTYRLKTLRLGLIKPAFPLVDAYLGVLEPTYKHRVYEEFGEEAHDFPIDVAIVIAEFASPPCFAF